METTVLVGTLLLSIQRCTAELFQSCEYCPEHVGLPGIQRNDNFDNYFNVSPKTSSIIAKLPANSNVEVSRMHSIDNGAECFDESTAQPLENTRMHMLSPNLQLNPEDLNCKKGVDLPKKEARLGKSLLHQLLAHRRKLDFQKNMGHKGLVDFNAPYLNPVEETRPKRRLLLGHYNSPYICPVCHYSPALRHHYHHGGYRKPMLQNTYNRLRAMQRLQEIKNQIEHKKHFHMRQSTHQHLPEALY